MSITICHVKDAPKDAIYVGRKMFNYTPRRGVTLPFDVLSQIHIGSVLCNPFRAGETPDPIGRFKAYLWHKMQQGSPLICAELKRIAALVPVQFVTLACWCANEPRGRYFEPSLYPDGCHADVIANAVMYLVFQQMDAAEVVK